VRLVHFSDLHLGIETHGRLNPRTGVSTRVQDFLDRLDEVVDFAVSRDVDAVLFSGDAFKSRDPNPTLQREFAQRIRRLIANEIPTVLLIGNHDLPGIAARATAIEIYDALEIPGVHVARQIQRIDVETKSGTLQIVTLPWIAPSAYMRDDEWRRLEPGEFQRRMAEQISAAVTALADDLEPGLARVLLAHVSIEGARLGSEQSIMLGRDIVLSTEQLAFDRFDYVALGHIHGHQQIGAHPPSVYAGSLERIDFGEERDEKGFVEVVIDPTVECGRRAEFTFIPVLARRLTTLRIDATSSDPLSAVEREIERRADDIRGAIVRCFVRVAADHEEQVRSTDVRRLIEAQGAYSVAQVVRDAPLVQRLRVSILEDRAQDAEYLLDEWLKLRDLPEATRQRILARGRDLIRSRDRSPDEA
jgi:DNA repair protein SbcD/Mre11